MAHDVLGPRRRRVRGMVGGTLAGVDARGCPLVAWPAERPAGPARARSAVAITPSHVGRDVALLFDRGDPRRPVIVGLLEARVAADHAVRVDADGERVVISAEREIVLRCGEASITLTRAGKVLIKGEYVLTRASGVNRIRGGSVQIN